MWRRVKEKGGEEKYERKKKGKEVKEIQEEEKEEEKKDGSRSVVRRVWLSIVTVA